MVVGGVSDHYVSTDLRIVFFPTGTCQFTPPQSVCAETAARKMASSAGFLLIRNAIPLELAQRGADAISNGLNKKGVSEKITEYEVPPISKEITDAFIKVGSIFSTIKINMLTVARTKTTKPSFQRLSTRTKLRLQ